MYGKRYDMNVMNRVKRPAFDCHVASQIAISW